MPRSETPAAGRTPGSIDRLPSGALRVRVYAGRDPVTGRRHDLVETIPPGTPKAMRRAEAARRRLVTEVESRRNPRTSATLAQLLDRYLDQFDGAPNTLRLYHGYVRLHIAPFIGTIKVGALDADILDSLYAELRRCRDHCDGRPRIQHRVKGKHICDPRCGPHECKPLAASTIRHIHYILSGAYRRAVRWHWVGVNPVRDADPPSPPKSNPRPPTAAEAARILNEAWRDPDWGSFIWLAMTTGARRGELCALRWSNVDLSPERAVVWLRRAVSHDEHGKWAERDLKTHQQRRITLDPETVAVLTEHRERCEQRAAALGSVWDDGAFMFSPAPDGGAFPIPGSVSQRYDRLADRLRIDTTLHKLRHYSATELITAGVDARTVAGRLGHSGGGTTTLKTYTAWVSEADQRAAGSLSARMPSRPAPLSPDERAKIQPRSRFEKVAATLYRAILGGALPDGAPAPTVKQLATEHDISIGTAHRVLTLLREWGVIAGEPGQRGTITRPESAPVPNVVESAASGRRPLDVELVHRGRPIKTFRTEADPDSTAELRRLLADAVLRNGDDESHIGEYELTVRSAGGEAPITTFAVSAY